MTGTKLDHENVCKGCLHFLRNELDCIICKFPNTKEMKCDFKEKDGH